MEFCLQTDTIVLDVFEGVTIQEQIDLLVGDLTDVRGLGPS
jgi:hypothetical protein